ncbi:MAG: 4'-phosphopantetheinyl transferase superfamily protein [Desulfovibrio sp.]|nr:4'-phosphopantetheinyl transferase superfamily protein [Desulfovibrio sp.]
MVADRALLEACRHLVAPEEMSQACRYARLGDAVSHLMGRVLVRQVLRATFGLEVTEPFHVSPYGKPYCPQCAAFFSISHCHDMVWVALCREGAVGIDVENVSALSEFSEIVAHLHPSERAYLLDLDEGDRPGAYCRCWTRKESVLKAVGRGLSLPLDVFAVDVGPVKENWIVSLPVPLLPDEKGAGFLSALTGQWTSAQVKTGENHCCSVAVAAPHRKLRVLSLMETVWDHARA